MKIVISCTIFLSACFAANGQKPVFIPGPAIEKNISFVRPLYTDTNRFFCYVLTTENKSYIRKYITRDFSLIEEHPLPGIHPKNENNPLPVNPIFILPGFFLVHCPGNRDYFYPFSTLHGADTSVVIDLQQGDNPYFTSSPKTNSFFLTTIAQKKYKKTEYLVLKNYRYNTALRKINSIRDSIPLENFSPYLFENSICDSKGNLWILINIRLNATGRTHVLFKITTENNKSEYRFVDKNCTFETGCIFETSNGKIGYLGAKTEILKHVLKFRVVTKIYQAFFSDYLEKEEFSETGLPAEKLPNQSLQRDDKTVPMLSADLYPGRIYSNNDSTFTIAFESNGSLTSTYEGNTEYKRYMSYVWLIRLNKEGKLLRQHFIPKYQLNTITEEVSQKSIGLFGLGISWTKNEVYGSDAIENYFSYQLLHDHEKEFVLFNDTTRNSGYDPHSISSRYNTLHPFTDFRGSFLHAWESGEAIKHYPVIDKNNSTLMITTSCLNAGKEMLIGIFDNGEYLYWGKIVLKKE